MKMERTTIDSDVFIEMGTDTESVNIGIIEEDNLVQYTDDHFVNRLNNHLALIRSGHLDGSTGAKQTNVINRGYNMLDFSNSPIIMSAENSDNENDNDVCNDENYFDEEYITNDSGNQKDFKKLSFQQVRNSLDKYYNNEDKFSSEFDILTTYVKGQKHLYLKAKSVTQSKLNCLMFPSLLSTAGITVFAPMITDWKYNGIIISILNAIATFLFSIVHYLKLESSCELFSHLAVQYDKLESSLEMTGNKLYIAENSVEKTRIMLSKMNDIEKKINEIRDTNSVFVPEELRRFFPIICHINIFSFIKRIETYKKNLIIKFRDIKNEIRYIKWKYPMSFGSIGPTSSIGHPSSIGPTCSNDPLFEHRFIESLHMNDIKRFEYLCVLKEKIKNELLHYRNAYGYIDELFIKEIKNAENISLIGLYYGSHIKSVMKDCNNPVITEYLNSISAA